jgi:hypothetical protein
MRRRAGEAFWICPRGYVETGIPIQRPVRQVRHAHADGNGASHAGMTSRIVTWDGFSTPGRWAARATRSLPDGH